jgi:hypothetical protein
MFELDEAEDGACTRRFLYKYLDADAVSFVVLMYCLNSNFARRRLCISNGVSCARSEFTKPHPTLRQLLFCPLRLSLLQSSVHVKLLSVPPPPLHGVCAHLHTRTHTSRVCPSSGEDLYTLLASACLLVASSTSPKHPR